VNRYTAMKIVVIVALGAAMTGVLSDYIRAQMEPTTQVPGGDVNRAKQEMQMYGCGSCHEIPGVPAAHGAVGPPLSGMGKRAYVAGKLPNEPDNLIYWIQHPQSVWPGNAMPNLGVTDQDARDIAAYLYTLK